VSKSLPAVSISRAHGPVKAVVLVLHGGRERGDTPMRPWNPAFLRMIPLARAVHLAGADGGIEVRLMRNRVRGWNAPDPDPVCDARWALDRIREDHPGVSVVLVGHSMGGRVALRVADDPAVAGVCALAPWSPSGEPVGAVAGRAVLIVHGTRDRRTDPAGSYSFASRAESGTTRLARFEVREEGHAMLRRADVWTRLVCAFTLDLTAGFPPDETLAAVWTKPRAERLRIPV
jgi:dienelactone hydrolase